MVQDGANKSVNYGNSSVCWVRNNSTNAAGRSAAFVKFHLPVIYKPDIQFALLTVRAASINGGTNAQAHVYGLTNNAWSQSNLIWATAPNLAQNVPAGLNYTNNFILGAGEGRKHRRADFCRCHAGRPHAERHRLRARRAGLGCFVSPCP